ncbi:MAG TPA: hypothetical protein VEW48_16840 [Thermoanaerobaculia bacterium]|nr:hypothetical protein [Thermoanaerobaculia bacterium]
MNPPVLHFSGLHGETGKYAVPSGTPSASMSLLNGEALEREETEALESWVKGGAKGLAQGDERDLAQAGWGVLFTQKNEKEAEKIREALKPLLDLRCEQASRLAQNRYREYFGKRGYREGDSKRKFLERFGVTAGEVNPDDMPYYLLIVGDPRDIPYEVQCLLDVERAVGRLWFDSIEEYDRYARRVVAAESAMAARQRRAVFFAPRHNGDVETGLCVDHLVKPVAAHVRRTCEGWKVREILGEEASKGQLAGAMSGSETPDFLFTAGHGMVFDSGDCRQLPHQGALVCSDWPGHSWQGRVPTDFYFSGDDIRGMAGSLVAFLFACFSGGALPWRSYDLQKRVAMAPHSFVAGLPRALLGRAEGGALAVVGHVDLAWTYSFHTPSPETPIERLTEFKQMVERILQGYPVGAAMEIFGRRYAALATDLCEELLAVQQGKVPDDETSFRLWLCQDARNYIVLGDPAVRLVPPEAQA